jgi:hypothetical protein
MTSEKTTWTRTEIDNLLRRSPKAVERAILRLYALQRPREQETRKSIYHNLEGFSGFDAKTGSMLARIIMGGLKRGKAPGTCLHGANRAKALRIALKHSKQLVVMANSSA